ncbi:hypothetical protein ACWIGW_40335 [Nocardia brasiliensis]
MRVVATRVALLAAFLIVFTLLVFGGRRLESLPPALNALIFTAALVPIMGNVVMPLVNSTLARLWPTKPPASPQ